MKVTFERSNVGDFSINIEGAQREDVLAIRAITDQQQQITPPVYFDEVRYAEPRDWSGVQQQAFVKAAQMVFRETQNKITTIKFLRSLSDPPLGLKDAKDMTDYAIHGAVVANVTWLKE